MYITTRKYCIWKVIGDPTREEWPWFRRQPRRRRRACCSRLTSAMMMRTAHTGAHCERTGVNGCIIVLCDRGSSYYVLYGIIINYVFIMYYVLCYTAGHCWVPKHASASELINTPVAAACSSLHGLSRPIWRLYRVIVCLFGAPRYGLPYMPPFPTDLGVSYATLCTP